MLVVEVVEVVEEASGAGGGGAEVDDALSIRFAATCFGVLPKRIFSTAMPTLMQR